MANRSQFRLRTIFYLTAAKAVLCIILPPLFHAIERRLAERRRPIHIIVADEDSVAVEVIPATGTSGDPVNTVPPEGGVFFQTTIMRVNGQRIDQPPNSSIPTSAGAETDVLTLP